MHYAALASGSKGNCHALSDGERTLLIDAGISLLQIRQRLEAVGWDQDQIQGLALTHEHSDHVGALGVILRRTTWAILATADTRRAAEKAQAVQIPNHRWIELEAGQPTDWSGWRVLPFALPHDAADPVAFRVEAGGQACAVVTDLGHPTELVADYLQDLDFLALEANHDVDMLREGSYPPQLKARILSRVGHLSNAAMAELLSRACSSRLQQVVLAHLSESNNHPDLARFAAEEVLRDTGITLRIAHQREPLALSFGLCWEDLTMIRRTAALLLLAACLRADGPPPLREVVERFDSAQAQVQTLQCPFTLTLRRALLKTPSVTRGTLYLQGSEFAHFAFQPPEDLILHLTPKALISYSPEAKEGELMKIGFIKNSDRKFLGLGQKLSYLSDYFQIALSEAREAPLGTWFLALTPRTLSLRKRMQAMNLWVDKETWLPRQVQWVERSGDTWLLELGTLKINQALPPAVTGFKLPEGIPLRSEFSFFATRKK